jgi:hypothetical protein
VVTTVPNAALLRLRRQDFDLDEGRLRVDLMATRQPGGPEGRLLFGLPPWCVAQLRLTFPGLDAWDEGRLLCPAEGAPHRPRREASDAFRRAANACGCQNTTLPSLRRLALSIHGRAPRAVRRSTATARFEDEGRLEEPADRREAEAQEAYAEWVTSAWTALHAPPTALASVPKRAPAGVAPEDPERFRKVPTEATGGLLVSGCRVLAGSGARTVRGADEPGPLPPTVVPADPWAVPGRSVSAAAPMMPGPLDALLFSQLAEGSMRHAQAMQARAERAERELAQLRALAADPTRDWALTVFLGSTAFASGMAFQDWLHSRPDVQAKLRETGKRLGRYAGQLAGALAKEMLRQGGDGTG